MIIQFPDGFSIDTSKGVLPFLDRPVTLISFMDQAGSVGAYKFAGQSVSEMVQMYQQIMDGVVAKLDFLQLLSSAPLPTNGNATATDMFLYNSVAVPTVVAGAYCYLNIGDPGVGYWPSLMGQGDAAHIQASFRPQGVVTIGGQQVLQQKYISALALQFFLPALPPGATYGVTYTDTRGTVTKAASITY